MARLLPSNYTPNRTYCKSRKLETWANVFVLEAEINEHHCIFTASECVDSRGSVLFSKLEKKINTVSYQYSHSLRVYFASKHHIDHQFPLPTPTAKFPFSLWWIFIHAESLRSCISPCEERSLPRRYRTERYWPNWDNIRALKGCQQRMPIVIHQPTPTLALTVQRVLQRLGKDALKNK